MIWFNLIVAALAAWQAVEIWHHGKIFAEARAIVELWDDTGFRGFVGAVLSCPLCLSVWVGLVTALIMFWAVPMLDIIVCGLAVARLANLGNDLVHRWCRTPRSEQYIALTTEATDGGCEDTGPTVRRSTDAGAEPSIVVGDTAASGSECHGPGSQLPG